MAYFADLTPYSYFSGKFAESPNALNVGWLDRSQPLNAGPTPEGFDDLLIALAAENTVNLCRGWHTCQWCSKAQGNGEIRVTGEDGTIYASPVLIAHYVSGHQYQPPEEFIEAVMSWAYRRDPQEEC